MNDDTKLSGMLIIIMSIPDNTPKTNSSFHKSCAVMRLNP